MANRRRHRRRRLQLGRRAGRDAACGADAAGAARLRGPVRRRHAVAGRHRPHDLSLRRASGQRREPAGRDRRGAHPLVLEDEEAGFVRGGPCRPGPVRGHRPRRPPPRAGAGHGARVLARLRRCRHRDERRGPARGRRPVRWRHDVRRAHRRTAARDSGRHRLLHRPAGAGQRDASGRPAPSSSGRADRGRDLPSVPAIACRGPFPRFRIPRSRSSCRVRRPPPSSSGRWSG